MSAIVFPILTDSFKEGAEYPELEKTSCGQESLENDSEPAMDNCERDGVGDEWILVMLSSLLVFHLLSISTSSSLTLLSLSFSCSIRAKLFFLLFSLSPFSVS